MGWLTEIFQGLFGSKLTAPEFSDAAFYTAGSVDTSSDRGECEQAILAVLEEKGLDVFQDEDERYCASVGDRTAFMMTRGGMGQAPLDIAIEIWELDGFRRVGVFVEDSSSVVGRVGVMAELSQVNEKRREAAEVLKDSLLRMILESLQKR